MNTPTRVTTAEVSAAAGCSDATLFRWVRRGLLESPARVGSSSGGMKGYFPAETIERVKRIVALREMGYSLDEIKKEFDKEARLARARRKGKKDAERDE